MAKLTTRSGPTNGSIMIEAASEVHGRSLLCPDCLSNLTPEADPITYTMIAEPLGIRRAVVRSMLRK